MRDCSFKSRNVWCIQTELHHTALWYVAVNWIVIYGWDLLAVWLKVNKYERKLFGFSYSSEVLFSSSFCSLFFPPHFEFQGCTCMTFVYFLTLPAAILFHLVLLLRVDKQVFFFCYRVICERTFISVSSLNAKLDAYCSSLPGSEGTQTF